MVAIDLRCRLRREEQMERRVSSSNLQCAPCTVRTLLNLAPADLAVRLQKSGTLFLQLPARIEPALILFVGTLLRLFCIYYFFTYLRLLYFNFSRGKKVAHTRLPSVGFRSWSRFLAVSVQVTWVIYPAVGCRYFPPGLQLPPQPSRGLLPILLLGEQRHDGYEQFA